MTKKYFKPTIAITLTFAILVMFQSCGKLASLLQYNNLSLQPQSFTITIPPTSDTTNTQSLGSATNSYNVDSFIKANTASTLGISNITSVKIKSIVLTIQNQSTTSTNNFANFESCNASFYSNSNTTPYAVSITGNPDVTATTLTLPVDTTADLKSYLSGTTFTYSLGGKLRRATTDSIKCTVQYTFSLNVQG